MKRFINFTRCVAGLLIACMLLCGIASAQSKKQAKREKRLQELKSLVESKNFQFAASYMRAIGGGGRALDSGNGVRFSPDGLISQLPYAGVSMQASIDSKSLLDFTSKNYEYTMLSGDTGGWQITIIPKDYPNVIQMVLTIDDEGEATLAVKSGMRDPISFSGTVEPLHR